MSSFDGIKGILVGVILAAAGVAMITSESGIQIIVNVGWIFLVGGIAAIGLAIYSTIKG